jgi:hypothetical protein
MGKASCSYRNNRTIEDIIIAAMHNMMPAIFHIEGAFHSYLHCSIDTFIVTGALFTASQYSGDNTVAAGVKAKFITHLA